MKHWHVAGCSVAIALVLALPAEAQRSAPRLGVIAGVNFATASGEDTEGTGTRTALMFGGLAEIGLSRTLAIRPEVIYSMQGATFEDGSDEGEVKLDYVQIPVLLQVRVPGAEGAVGQVTPHFYLGPVFSFKTSCKGSANSGPDIDCEDITDFAEFKSSDVGAMAGAGLDIGAFQLGVRYNLGLTNILDVVGDDEDVKNRVFSIYAGFSFRLK